LKQINTADDYDNYEDESLLPSFELTQMLAGCIDVCFGVGANRKFLMESRLNHANRRI